MKEGTKEIKTKFKRRRFLRDYAMLEKSLARLVDHYTGDRILNAYEQEYTIQTISDCLQEAKKFLRGFALNEDQKRAHRNFSISLTKYHRLGGTVLVRHLYPQRRVKYSIDTKKHIKKIYGNGYSFLTNYRYLYWHHQTIRKKETQK